MFRNIKKFVTKAVSCRVWYKGSNKRGYGGNDGDFLCKKGTKCLKTHFGVALKCRSNGSQMLPFTFFGNSIMYPNKLTNGKKKYIKNDVGCILFSTAFEPVPVKILEKTVTKSSKPLAPVE